ncbi:MAG TPA: serine protease [Methylomirabilota bacterium]|nr:serine protease [Methylomirabilota bacterium]
MKATRKTLLISVAAIACATGLLAASVPDDPDADGSLSAAIGPIVYRLDESPSAHGFHYTFYGNGFFINEDGYLLTVAHVLESFNNGGQASIQVSRPNSPPQLLTLSVIASDVAHDVAILRATPNPFTSHCHVTYLPLTANPAVSGQAVLALSLHPARLQNAHSFQIPVEDRSPGQVLNYESTQLDKSSPPADLFLLSHPVTRGQSGSPVVAADSRAVVGLIEGRWLRSSAISLTQSSALRGDTPGAAIPIHYAISLLDRKGVHWHASAAAAAKSEPAPKP